MRERWEGMESPGAYVDHWCLTRPFLQRYFGPLSHALVYYHLVRCGMPLHDAVGVNCEKGCNY